MFKLHNEILKDDQNRNEPMFMKMERKRIITDEFKHHKGKATVLSTKSQQKAEEEKYPWEIREEQMKHEVKNMIVGKPGH